MRLQLDVPRLIAERGKYSCVPTCTAMLAAYHGFPLPIARVAGEMGMGPTDPAWLFQAGNFFLARGFEAVHYGGDRLPLLKEAGDLHGDVNARLDLFDRCAKYFADRPEELLRYFLPLIRFVRLGGVFLPYPLSPDALRREIADGHPPMVAVEVSVLWGADHDPGSHAVIATGFDGRTVAVADPSDPTREYPAARFFEACEKVGGPMLCVRPKRPGN